MPFALKYGAVEILSLFDQETGLSTGDFAGDLNSSTTAENAPCIIIIGKEMIELQETMENFVFPDEIITKWTKQ